MNSNGEREALSKERLAHLSFQGENLLQNILLEIFRILKLLKEASTSSNVSSVNQFRQEKEQYLIKIKELKEIIDEINKYLSPSTNLEISKEDLEERRSLVEKRDQLQKIAKEKNGKLKDLIDRFRQLQTDVSLILSH